MEFLGRALSPSFGTRLSEELATDISKESSEVEVLQNEKFFLQKQVEFLQNAVKKLKDQIDVLQKEGSEATIVKQLEIEVDNLKNSAKQKEKEHEQELHELKDFQNKIIVALNNDFEETRTHLHNLIDRLKEGNKRLVEENKALKKTDDLSPPLVVLPATSSSPLTSPPSPPTPHHKRKVSVSTVRLERDKAFSQALLRTEAAAKEGGEIQGGSSIVEEESSGIEVPSSSTNKSGAGESTTFSVKPREGFFRERAGSKRGNKHRRSTSFSPKNFKEPEIQRVNYKYVEGFLGLIPVFQTLDL
jgi:hypothetical protein